MSQLNAWVRRALWDVVPRDHREEPRALRRRQLVTAGFVLLGAVVLGFSLRIEPGSNSFYLSTVVLASVWAVGAVTSGPLHLGRITAGEVMRRPILTPIAIGAAMAGVFVVGGLIVRDIPFLGDQVRSVIEYANQGYLPILVAITLVNGIAEELFFRGAAYASITQSPVAWTTLAYGVATLATGNVMLSLAAVLLGVVVGLERRASGGILGPILTHVTWSLSMLLILPLVFF